MTSSPDDILFIKNIVYLQRQIPPRLLTMRTRAELLLLGHGVRNITRLTLKS